jgi:hypothetical protein
MSIGRSSWRWPKRLPRRSSESTLLQKREPLRADAMRHATEAGRIPKRLYDRKQPGGGCDIATSEVKSLYLLNVNSSLNIWMRNATFYGQHI